MTGRCCGQLGVFALERRLPLGAVDEMGGPATRRPGLPFSRVTASIVSAVVLAFLPKCPLCLAAWLTVATGVGFSAAGAAWVRGMLVALWVAAVALAWRRSFGVRRHPLN